MIAAGSSGSVVAMDRAKGEIRWVATTGATIVGGAALTPDGRIVVGSSDGCIYLLNATNGENLWMTRTGGKITAEPGIRDKFTAVPSRDGYLYGIRLN